MFNPIPLNEHPQIQSKNHASNKGKTVGTHLRGIGLISLNIQGLFGRSKFGCEPISNNFTP